MNKQAQEQLPSDFQGRMDDFVFEVISSSDDEKAKDTPKENKSKDK